MEEKKLPALWLKLAVWHAASFARPSIFHSERATWPIPRKRTRCPGLPNGSRFALAQIFDLLTRRIFPPKTDDASSLRAAALGQTYILKQRQGTRRPRVAYPAPCSSVLLIKGHVALQPRGRNSCTSPRKYHLTGCLLPSTTKQGKTS